MTIAQLITGALSAAGVLTAVEIAAVSGMNERGTRKILHEMVLAGRIRRVMSGWRHSGPYRYALPLKEPVKWYPWAQAGEYVQLAHSGTAPEDCCRLMAEV